MKGLGDLAGNWPQLSGLLDEALSLPAEQRAGWLTSLPQEHAALGDTLARLLGMQGGVNTHELLNTLPRLGDGLPGASAAVDGPGPGDEVGPYRLVRELGRGGMGSVWLAERADGQLRRSVALKLPRLTWADGLAQRMARERDILASLEHPHIARLYDAGVDPLGRPWLALEHVQGLPIGAYASGQGLAVRARIDLLLQVCEVVAYAHSRLVIHRDLKPSNILVTDDGQVRLLDFGIARLVQPDGGAEAEPALTEAAGRAMTLQYASPEQVRGETLSTATDVYSLGVVAYELLAGALPYRLKRGSAAELEEAVAQGEAQRASDRATDAATRRALRGDLDAVLAKALHADQKQRYPSITAFADDLQRFLAQRPVRAQPDLWRYRAAKLVARYRWPFALSTLALLSVLAAAAAALHQARAAADERDRARLALETNEQVQEFVTSLFAVPQPPDIKYIDQGLARVRAEQGKVKDAVRARMLLALANLYVSIGRWEPAQAVFREAAALGQHASDYATAADVMAWHAISQCNVANDVPAALGIAERGMALAQEHVPGDTRVLARLNSALTVCLTNVGRYGDAMPFARRAVELHTALDGAAHVRTLAARGDLARVEHRAGQHAQAKASYVRLLDDMKRELGPDHDNRLMALENFGSLLSEMDEHDAAEAALRDAIDMRTRRLGPDHPTASAAYSIIGRALIRGGKPVEAVSFLERALEMERQESEAPGAYKVYLKGRLACASVHAGRLADGERWRQAGEAELQRLGPAGASARRELYDNFLPCWLLTGQPAQAAELQRLSALAPLKEGSRGALLLQVLQVLPQARTDAPAAAARLRDLAASLSDTQELLRPVLLLSQARVARQAGDAAGADRFYRDALQQPLSSPRCAPRLVPAALEWVDLLTELGRPADAQQGLARLGPCAALLGAGTAVRRDLEGRLARWAKLAN